MKKIRGKRKKNPEIYDENSIKKPKNSLKITKIRG